MRITNTGNVGIGTSTPVSLLDVNGATTTNTLIADNSTGPQVSLTGSTSNWVAWNANGVAAPTFTTSSAGTKLLLYPNISGSSVDYAIGIENNTQWFSVPTAAGQQFKWYGGTTQAMLLSGAGALTTASTISDSAGNVRDLVNNSKTAAYVLAASDNGKMINITTGGVTTPNTIFSAGQNITIYNNSASNQTITQGVNVTMYLAGLGTTGNRTLGQRGIATIVCVAANTFVISGAGLT